MEAQAHVHAMAATMAQAAISPPMPPGARAVPSPNTSRPGSMGQQRPAVAAAPPPKPADLEDAMKGLSVEEKAPAKASAPAVPAVAPPPPPAGPPPAEKEEEEEAEEGEAAPAPAEEEAPVDMSGWTPPAEGGPAAGTATPGSGKCVYTVDFLKAFEKGPQCQRAPADLEAPDDVDYWPLIGFTPPPGMMGGGGRRGGRGGPQWNGPPGGGGRGGRGGRGGDDRWGHKGLPPDQQGDGRRGGGRRGGFGNYGAPVNNRHDPRLPQLQQTENKFVAIDKSKLDEEEKKQRAFKSILNKLTPQNFEKLLEQILAEGIDEAQTLIGLIGQLFDKALTEPTFAELYAMMCQQLSNRFLAENIEFVDPDCDPDAEGGPRMINFKRVLLNKCQEEFEKGDSAIKAVEQEEIDDENEKKARMPPRRRRRRRARCPPSPRLRRSLSSTSAARFRSARTA